MTIIDATDIRSFHYDDSGSGECNYAMTADKAINRMWANMSRYQPIADSKGYGEIWADMVNLKTREAMAVVHEFLGKIKTDDFHNIMKNKELADSIGCVAHAIYYKSICDNGGPGDAHMQCISNAKKSFNILSSFID